MFALHLCNARLLEGKRREEAVEEKKRNEENKGRNERDRESSQAAAGDR